jgi:hypothetical protein
MTIRILIVLTATTYIIVLHNVEIGSTVQPAYYPADIEGYFGGGQASTPHISS